MELDVLLEGYLFYTATPQPINRLAKVFAVTESDVQSALAKLNARLDGSALCVVTTEHDASLRTAPALGEFVAAIRKNELKTEIGKAGAETLAIIVYRGPVSRTTIDEIRGVNCGHVLRTLEMKGLIKRNENKKDVRYFATNDLLAHLGVTDITKLAGYQQHMAQLDELTTTTV
jgi:segregation and condensation protein B